MKQEVCRFDNLYKAMTVCKKNVLWKDSVAGYMKNSLANIHKLREELLSETYEISKYSTFKVHEPKERDIVSTRMRDRVFQRSLCDNYLTETVSKSFIFDNCACQIGKGTDFARNRLKLHLHRHYQKHGLNGYVLRCDLRNYFGSTPHKVAIEAMRKRCPDQWACSEVERIINSFTQGPDPSVGMGLGSQVTQLIELAVLDDMDHYIKERLHVKQYIRYMDDFILIHPSKEYLKFCREEIERIVHSLGLELNQKKTQLSKISQPIPFLGFSFRLTETGAVIMRINPQKVSHERRKLKRLVQRAKDGYMTRLEVDNCFVSWKAHASKGNTYFIIKNMENFYMNLWEEKTWKLLTEEASKEEEK